MWQVTRFPSAANGPRLRLSRALEGAGSPILLALGWQTMTDGAVALAGSFSTIGGTTIETELFGNIAITLGGSARVIINGGEHVDKVLSEEPATLGGGGRSVNQKGTLVLAQAASYTVTAQARGIGLGSSATPGIGLYLMVKEWP